MDGTPLVSIVMPAYGVEAYIGKAIACIQAQTIVYWELIVVDDASPDRSAAIAEAAAAEDPRITVLHHGQNQGLSGARNTGMAHACGTYLWFCDPDDTYDSDLLGCAVSALKRTEAQVAVFGVREEYYNAKGAFQYENVVQPEPGACLSAERVHGRMLQLERETCYGYAWNKVYDRAFLASTGATFENVKLIEDITFNVAVFDHVDRMVVLDRAPYRYARRIDDNLTNKFLPDYFELHERRIQMLFDQQQAWGTLDDDARAILGSLYARYVLSALERNFDPRAQMRSADRAKWCERVFSSSLYNELIPYAQAEDSRALAEALKPLQTKEVKRTLQLARVIHIARDKFLPLFTKIKSGR